MERAVLLLSPPVVSLTCAVGNTTNHEGNGYASSSAVQHKKIQSNLPVDNDNANMRVCAKDK